MTDPTPEMLREDASDGIQYEAALAYVSAWTADREARDYYVAEMRLAEELAEKAEARIEELEKRLAKLQPPSTLDRMIDEGYIDDSPSDC